MKRIVFAVALLSLAVFVACKSKEDVAPPPAVLIPPDARGTFDRDANSQKGYAKLFTYEDKIAAYDRPLVEDQLHVMEGERAGETGYRAKRILVVRWRDEKPNWVLVERCSGAVTFDEQSRIEITLGGSARCTAWNGSYSRTRDSIAGHARPQSTALDWDAGYLPPDSCRRYRDCVCTLRIDDARYARRCADIASSIHAEKADPAACNSDLDVVAKELREAKSKLPWQCELRDAGTARE